MLRVLPLLLMLPTPSAAEIAPTPQMFRYDATFARCTADPTAPDLTEACQDVLTQAYLLKRAVARAVAACDLSDPATCDASFAAEGLPAVALTIARDAGCTATRITQTDEPLPQDHCITIAADVLLDEGVVPLDTHLSCETQGADCNDLIRVNAALWAQAAARAAGDDPARPDPYAEDCAAVATQARDPLPEIATFECSAHRNAALWSELTRAKEGSD